EGNQVDDQCKPAAADAGTPMPDAGNGGPGDAGHLPDASTASGGDAAALPDGSAFGNSGDASSPQAESAGCSVAFDAAPQGLEWALGVAALAALGWRVGRVRADRSRTRRARPARRAASGRAR